jgi:hypothetical protein
MLRMERPGAGTCRLVTCPYAIESDRPVEIEPTPDGPLLVRHATAVTDADGTTHEVRRAVVGLCVCGYSQRGPFCDGTHKVAVRSS